MWLIMTGSITLIFVVVGFPALKDWLDSMVILYHALNPASSAFNSMIANTMPIWVPVLMGIAGVLTIWMGLTGRGQEQ